MYTIKFDRFIFAERLCIAMEKAKVTSTALANFLMVDKHTILTYRKGDSIPNAEKLYYVSRALKVSVDWLLGIEEAVATVGVDLASCEDRTGTPFVSFSNTEIEEAPALGREAKCRYCGELHEVHESNPPGLSYVKCAEKIFIVGLKGKRLF